MAWRNPRYCILHAARTAGASAISSTNAFNSSYPKDYLIDNRAGDNAVFNASAADHSITLDRGAAGLEAIDRLIIPVGHNLNGANIRVRAADDSGITSNVATILATTAISAATQIDQTLTSNTQRYVRLDFPSSTGTWALPELIYTRTRTPGRGPDPGWVDMYEHNTRSFETASGVAAIISRGADRRFFEFIYRDCKSSDDRDIFDDLITECGRAQPFYMDPPFDTESALWCRLVDNVQRGQDDALPAATGTPMRRYVLKIGEHQA